MLFNDFVFFFHILDLQIHMNNNYYLYMIIKNNLIKNLWDLISYHMKIKKKIYSQEHGIPKHFLISFHVV